AGRAQALLHYPRQARGDPAAEGIRLLTQHVRQPMRPLAEHVRQEHLDLTPPVVESLEEELQVRGKRRVLFGCEQRLARGRQVELGRARADRQLAPGAGRDGELTREPEVE